MAAAATNGEVRLTGTRLDLVAAVARILEGAGVEVAETADGLTVRRYAERLEGVDVMTEPYPGFPTDLQAQIMALMTIANGASMITETISRTGSCMSRNWRAWGPTSTSMALPLWCAACRG